MPCGVDHLSDNDNPWDLGWSPGICFFNKHARQMLRTLKFAELLRNTKASMPRKRALAEESARLELKSKIFYFIFKNIYIFWAGPKQVKGRETEDLKGALC